MGEYWQRFKQLPPARKFEVILAVGVTVLLLVIVLGVAAISLQPPTSEPTASSTPTVTATVIYPTFPLTLTPLTPTLTPTFDPLNPYPPTQVTPTPTSTPTLTQTKTATWFLTSFPSSTLVPWRTWTYTRHSHDVTSTVPSPELLHNSPPYIDPHHPTPHPQKSRSQPEIDDGKQWHLYLIQSLTGQK